jgi:hypothetical protein
MKKKIQINVLILLCCLFGLPFISYGQDLNEIITKYSKTNDEEVGLENFSFSMSNGTIIITDLDSRTRETYGPLKYEGSGFEGGYFYVGFTSDIQQDPMRYRHEKPRAYKIYYKEKKGYILAILEGKIRQDNAQIIKIYYTELGNKLLNRSN